MYSTNSLLSLPKKTVSKLGVAVYGGKFGALNKIVADDEGVILNSSTAIAAAVAVTPKINDEPGAVIVKPLGPNVSPDSPFNVFAVPVAVTTKLSVLLLMVTPTPFAPLVPDEPVWPEVPLLPLVPELPEVPELPVIPEVPEEPLVPELPVNPEVPEDPVRPEVPLLPDEPDVPELPVIPEVPDDPVTPEVPLLPLDPLVPDDPVTPDVPLLPDSPEVPDDPVTPDVPLEPVCPLVPELPEVPLLPDSPEVPEEPLIPDVPEVPLLPAAAFNANDAVVANDDDTAFCAQLLVPKNPDAVIPPDAETAPVVLKKVTRVAVLSRITKLLSSLRIMLLVPS